MPNGRVDQTSLDNVLRDHRDRIRALEANAFALPIWIWQNISSGITVTRVSGGDSNPAIDVVIGEMFTIGGESIGGGAPVLSLNVVQLLITIGAGGAGSGTSAYVIGGLPDGFATASYMAGTGMFFQSAGAALYRCSMRPQVGGATKVLQWDGAAGLIPLGPKASTGGGPFDFAVGDTLYDGQVILP